jgi:hypothetical protein
LSKHKRLQVLLLLSHLGFLTCGHSSLGSWHNMLPAAAAAILPSIEGNTDCFMLS